jgi:hypothetical protein
MIDRNFLLTGLLAAVIALPAANAEAAMSKDQVAAQVAEEFGVQVLDVRPETADGKAVFVVKIMFLGGNFNTAFQVNTWVVDAETGKRIPQFRHRSSGHELSGGNRSRANRQPVDALRGHVWR